MNCPTCNERGYIGKTRRAPDNQTFRRYKCVAGHKWKTLEQIELVYTTAGEAELKAERARAMGANWRVKKEENNAANR